MDKKNSVIEDTFSKASLIASKRYFHDKDLLGVILEDKEYALKEVDTIIDEFKKRRVK